MIIIANERYKLCSDEWVGQGEVWACSVEKLKWADTYLSREQDLKKTDSRRLMESKTHEPVEVGEKRNGNVMLATPQIEWHK